MQIIIKAKNFELPPALETFIIGKLSGLKKFISSFENHELPLTEGRGLFDAFVDVAKDSNHHRKGDIFRTEIKLYLPGRNLFVKAHGEDLMKTIIEAREEMESEIRKYKSKVVEFPRRKVKKSQGRH